MKKDTTKQIFSFLANDILMLNESLSKINDRLDELDEALGFQNGSISKLETTVKKLSHDFHEEQKIDSYIVNVNQPNWLDRTIKDIEEMATEKKIREAIIAKLEKQQNANSCACGDTCQAYDNGFQDAINTIRDM